jgi:hypothetical protein
MLSADEQVGQLFVLSILLQTKRGRDVLAPRFTINFDSQRDRARDKLSGVNSEASIETPEQLTDVEEMSHAEEGELPRATDERMHQSDSDDDIQLEITEDVILSENQIKLALDNLDLSYVLDGIRPFLDCFHKRRLDQVLAQVLTIRNFRAVSQLALPPNLTNYQTVPVASLAQAVIPTDEAVIPPAPEFVHEFEVDEDRVDNSIKLPMDKFVYLVETVLSLPAFLKYGCSLLVSSPSGIADYKCALELFLRVLVATVERGEDSNQWCLQKMLELVHFLEDVLDYGPASGFSTETGERGLKKWAKGPSITCQNRGDEVFSGQVCSRIHERVLIDGVADAHPLDKDDIKENVLASIEVQLYCANLWSTSTEQPPSHECSLVGINTKSRLISLP